MQGIGKAARVAAKQLAFASTEQKNRALLAAASALRDSRADILAANEADIRESGAGLSAALLDRLRLDDARVEAMARGLARDRRGSRSHRRAHGRVVAPEWHADSESLRTLGRHRHHLREPAQCHRRCGCAVPEVRQCGDSARRFGKLEVERRHPRAVCSKGSSRRGCRRRAIQLVPTTDRSAVGHMLSDMADSIDVIVPRGGKSLISRVQKEARVPVIGHLEGVCHVYVHRDAELTMSKRIVLNAKMRRTGVCGSAETLLVDRACAGDASCALGGGAARGGLRGARR